MKVTTENNVKEYVLNRIENVHIGFNDNAEITLNHITEYNIDLDSIDYSTISFANAINNIEIENHFKNNKKSRVIYIHIDAIGYLIENGKEVKVFYDIPCDMIIRRFRLNGSSCCENMYVELEGIVN